MAQVDKQAKAAGKEVQFGPAQLLNPTPTFVRVNTLPGRGMGYCSACNY